MILDRVKKRIETDLDDTELQLLIDEANQEVINRFGPHANPSAPITEILDGHRKRLVLTRPVDTSQDIVVKEYYSYSAIESDFLTATTLADDDYQVISPYVLERRADGTNSAFRWGVRVEVTYTPVNDGDQREEVIIKLVQLSIEYDGVLNRTVGDVSANNLDYRKERENLFMGLAPRHGLYLQ